MLNGIRRNKDELNAMAIRMMPAAINHGAKVIRILNFDHPQVEIEKKIAIGEGHATASKGMLDVILDELKK